MVFHSADSAVIEEEADGNFQYPTQFLNSIKGSGLPLSKLRLKIRTPIMLLRNLDPSQGLCNGTRGILTRVTGPILEIQILGGDFVQGKTASIPCITNTI